MTDEELIEELARVIYAGRNNSPTCWKWDDSGLDDEHPWAREAYYRDAQAILPITHRREIEAGERVREACELLACGSLNSADAGERIRALDVAAIVKGEGHD